MKRKYIIFSDTIKKYKSLIKEPETGICKPAPAVVPALPAIISPDYKLTIKPAGIIKKRGSYYITAFKNGGRIIEKLTGWIFNINGLEVGAIKRGKIYSITDTRTGFYIGDAARLADVPATVEKLSNLIREKHEDKKDAAIQEIMNDIQKAYSTM